MNPAVVLIGPPAAGKTRVGKRLAKMLEVEFIDTDHVIAAEHGPIPAIFADRGEPWFREIERDTVAEALGRDAVLSLGGGAVLDPVTRERLTPARVVLLTVDPEAVADRIENDKRPLISGLDSWRRLVAERMDVYRSVADYTVDTSHRPMKEVARQIADWVKEQA